MCSLTLSSYINRALDILLIMTGLLVLTYIFTSFFHIDEDEEDNKEAKKDSNGTESRSHREELHSQFNAFRGKYIVVYNVIMLADWMQGTHMYTLYLSYNVNITALFLTGFLSGAIFAPFLGSLVDKFGRKRSCIA